MDDTIAKLETVANVSDSRDIKVLISILIDHLKRQDKKEKEFGFTAKAQ